MYDTCKDCGANLDHGEKCDCQKQPADIIAVKQLPIIVERLATIGAEIDRKTADALALDCTEDTVKTVKSLRADLNKDFAVIETKRAEVKAAIMKPYDEFNAVYARFVTDKYKDADNTLKARIDTVEGVLKDKKRAEVKSYFEEYAESVHIDFVTFDRAGINVILTASPKALKGQCRAFLDRISDDLALIDTQEHKTEILVEYKKSLNCSQAITAVTARHKAIEEEQARAVATKSVAVVEAETIKRVEAIAPPVVCASGAGQKTLTFKVTDTVERLRELKRFLDDGGYQYE